MHIVKTKKSHKSEPLIYASTHHDVLFFKGLTMPKPKERNQILKTYILSWATLVRNALIEICKRYYWHNHAEEVSKVIRTCYQC